MDDPYQVLGVSPGATDEEIKRAFRRLAKQVHPDLHPDDAAADVRFRGLVSAYQALSGGEAAVAPALRGRPGRRAQWVTMAVVFLLTLSSVGSALMLRWAGESPPRPVGPTPGELPAASASSTAAAALQGAPAAAGPATQASGDGGAQGVEAAALQQAASSGPRSVDPTPAATAVAPSRASIPHTAQEHIAAEDAGAITAGAAVDQRSTAAAADAPDRPATSPRTSTAASRPSAEQDGASAWAEFRSDRFGFSLAYPAEVFSTGPIQADEGTAFRSRDGRAALVVSTAMTGTPLAVQRRALMEGPYKGAAIDYAPRRAYWFVLSGILGDDIFYQRVTLSCDRRMVHGWKLVYPLAERALYDRITEEMHRRYRHSNGPRARCGETDQDGGGAGAAKAE